MSADDDDVNWQDFRESIEKMSMLLSGMDRAQVQDLQDMGHTLLRAHELLEELLKLKEKDPETLTNDAKMAIYYELTEKKEYLDAEFEDAKYFLQKISEMTPIIHTDNKDVRDAYIRYIEATQKLYEEHLRVMLLESEILSLYLLRLKLALYEI
ncbi:MAG: hypothetical protein GXO25_06005 [Euryarchaeota archaeon]|nr:hypothetical protein [Euryarchaeota archaeon]